MFFFFAVFFIYRFWIKSEAVLLIPEHYLATCLVQMFIPALGQNFCLLERWFPRNIWCCGINFLTKLSNPMREKHVLPLCWKFSFSPLETCHVCRALKFDDCVIYQLYLGWFAKTTWNFRTSKHLSEETTFKILLFNFLYLTLLFLFFYQVREPKMKLDDSPHSYLSLRLAWHCTKSKNLIFCSFF